VRVGPRGAPGLEHDKQVLDSVDRESTRPTAWIEGIASACKWQARRGMGDAARRRPIMPTYVVLTRLTPEAVKVPGELKRLERAVADHIRKDCPQVKWVANYAILGPYDYLDIFEAPDEITASKVVAVIRSYGHGHTETWTAIPWERFELVLPT
jgi:uncharacterized protein with GYD domain